MKRKKLEKVLGQIGRHIVTREDLKPEKKLTDQELLASAWAEWESYSRKNGRGQ